MRDRLQREEKTLVTMIKLHCKNFKHAENIPCKDCSELIDYARNRLKDCIFKEKKPVCVKCKIHCYQAEMRKKIKLVMKTTGHKMLIKHPILLFKHIIDLFQY